MKYIWALALLGRGERHCVGRGVVGCRLVVVLVWTELARTGTPHLGVVKLHRLAAGVRSTDESALHPLLAWTEGGRLCVAVVLHAVVVRLLVGALLASTNRVATGRRELEGRRGHLGAALVARLIVLRANDGGSLEWVVSPLDHVWQRRGEHLADVLNTSYPPPTLTTLNTGVQR